MSLTDVFAAYGNDADAALEAYANLDPAEWSEFIDKAAADTYRRRYASWMRAQKISVTTTSAQETLFGELDSEQVVIRSRIVGRKNGRRHEYEMTALAGAEAVDVLRAAADRDEAPARSTLIHADMLRRIANEVERLSALERRDVSVAEVLGVAA